MKIAILGYGKEGQSVEKYFQAHEQDLDCKIFNNFKPEELKPEELASYDYVFRSPSVPPLHLANETSITRYFFKHCPCPIIGVTATKGKGTICTFIKSLLDADHEDVHLVGNIGVPALDVLDQLTADSVVVYELSSFQLWDLERSPHIAVVGHIEPDHLNVHKSYDDYLAAKGNICRYQHLNDYCIYLSSNPSSVAIADQAHGHRIPYPFMLPLYAEEAIDLPGIHNVHNATAAIAAVASYYQLTPTAYLGQHQSAVEAGLASTKSLPHRLEFLRQLNNVDYYDDNFSTNVSSTRVAVEAFEGRDIILIAGGYDKTHNEDLADLFGITQQRNIRRAVLIGKSGRDLIKTFTKADNLRYASNLEAAVYCARLEAEAIATDRNQPVVLMSPGAASFDMFDNVYDRGAKYQAIIKNLEQLDSKEPQSLESIREALSKHKDTLDIID